MAATRDRDPEPAHLSFRTFVDTLREEGDLVEINDSVDPNLEAAAITRLVCETNDKAPLFNNVIGAKDGLFRILGAPGALRTPKSQAYARIAHHVALPPSSGAGAIIEKLLDATTSAPVDPITVQSGPVKENCIEGDAIDLTKIPAPMVHQTDGGKYIGTYGMHVLKSPDGKWVNWSVNRAMVVGKRTMTGACYPPQHNWQIVNKWREFGQDAPWAFVLGAPPAAVMVSAMPIPDNVTEAEFIGTLSGEPIRMVKCDTNDLLVPANAEIVFEGTISISEQVPEGPYSEMHGVNFPGESHMMPVYTVNKITYRNNPILPMSATGRLTDETQSLGGLVTAASVMQLCRDADLPILDVSSPLVSQCTWVAIKVDGKRLRSMKTTPRELAKQFGDVVFNTKAGVPFHRLLLVGEDIDVHSDADIMWAFSTRCRPGIDEHPFEDVRGFALIPYMSHGNGNPIKGGKLVCDCLFPVEYTEGRNWVNTSFKQGYPQDIQDKVLAKWEQRGFCSLDGN
ncbi:UbiD decarboxylyase family [Trichoderma camerunense]